ncbi:MAG: restriction endonuclease [Candidatus Moranbacteria bacterium]|nr:restriction endonuclease [Candidatus Moranbacteria bacterium]
MNIQPILCQIKNDFERTITTSTFNGKRYANGNKAKEALIRSQKIINLIHEFIKEDFISCGIPDNFVYPPVGSSKPEIKVKGFLKSKNQDVTIVPNPGLLESSNQNDQLNEKILCVNIRSQLSSLSKNIDTLYERTFAEALNLHLSYPKQCLGEVYLIPTHEYDDKAMLYGRVSFKSASKIEDYIRMFQAINNRRNTTEDGYKYERVCLLIVDFRPANPKMYGTISELKKDGLLPVSSTASLEKLTTKNFAKDLLAVYTKRFGAF